MDSNDRRVPEFAVFERYVPEHTTCASFPTTILSVSCAFSRKSVSRPPPSLATERNEQQLQHHGKDRNGKDDCRKRGIGCTTVRVPAITRYVPVWTFPKIIYIIIVAGLPGVKLISLADEQQQQQQQQQPQQQ